MIQTMTARPDSTISVTTSETNVCMNLSFMILTVAFVRPFGQDADILAPVIGADPDILQLSRRGRCVILFWAKGAQ